MNRTSRFVLASAILLLVPSVQAQDQDRADRIRESVQVLGALTETPDDRIPQYLLERAEAIVVIPDMIRGGFVIGAKHGKGIVSVRDRVANRWSPPAFVRMTGGSVGWQIGAQSVDLVLLVMNQNGVRKLLDNRFTLGGELSVTAGPVGRSASAATDMSLGSEILAYSRAKGLFAGATFEGVALQTDNDANRAFYGAALDLRDIVLDPSSELRVPVVALTWTDTLRNLSTRSAVGENAPNWGADRRNETTPRETSSRPPLPPLPPAPVYTTPPVGFSGTLAAVGDVAVKPKPLYGREVMVTASVENLYSRSVFTVDDDQLMSTGRTVIVVAPTIASPVTDNDSVSVIGQLIKFDKDDIEKLVRGYKLDLAEDVERLLKDKPVIVATSIRTKDGQELVGPRVIK